MGADEEVLLGAVDRSAKLNDAEFKMLSEWVGSGEQQYSDPFAVPHDG